MDAVNRKNDENHSIETIIKSLENLLAENSWNVEFPVSLPEILLEVINTEAAIKKIDTSKAIELLLLEIPRIRESVQHTYELGKADPIGPGGTYAASGEIFKYMKEKEKNHD